MTSKDFDLPTRKLDVIIKLLAFNIVDKKPVQEQVNILNKVGLNTPEIAKLLGKSAQQINVTKERLKKKQRGKK